MRQKQVIALVLAVLMLVGVLAGCGNKEAEEGIKIKVDGETVVVDTIATIAGVEVPAELYRYFFMNLKYSMDGGDESLWEEDPEAFEYLQMGIFNYMQNYAATVALAKEYGIEISAEDEKSIEDAINQAIDAAGSYANFEAQMEAAYLTEDLYRELVKLEIFAAGIEEHMFAEGGDHYVEEAELIEFVKENYVLSRHILISNSNENKETIIKEVQGKLDKGEDFRTLEEEYSEDTASTSQYPDGVCYKEGTMITDFYETALETEVGQISTVDTEEFGYFFINRLELTDDYIKKNSASLMDEYCNEIYNEVVSDFMDEAEIEYHESYDHIGLDAFN